MKRRFLFALCFCAASGLSVYAQKVTMNLQKVKLETVFNEITQQTGLSVAYSRPAVNPEKIVSVNANQEELADVLKRLFAGTDITFEIGKQKVFLRNALIEKKERESAQVKTVTGVVVDENGEPVIGASVVVQGTSNGTITDLDGKYSLMNVPEDATLDISYIGYQTLSLKADDKSLARVTMREDTEVLDEVVVIGYGTVRKRDLTGAVSQLNAEQIQKGPVSNILQSVQGRIPGLQITPASGQPGADNDVLIHGTQSINGTNSPIYVIDGTISENIGNLNPQDIETFTVLKDASAVAIYGSRAANGVIVINTKRGKTDEKPTISFKTEQSFQQEGNLKLHYLNADEWLEIATEAYENGGKDVPWNDNDLEQVRGIDNCWPDLMKRTGYLTNNNLSISGGSEKSNYFVSLNYLYNNGIIKDQSYNRLNLRLNSDHKIGKRIKFGHSINLYASEQISQRDFDYRDTYAAAFRYSPLNAMYDEEGDFASINNTYLQSKTPSPLWMLGNSERKYKNKGIDGNLYLTIDIIEGLKFTARVSGEWKNRYSDDFIGAMDTKYGMEGSNVNEVTKTNEEIFHWITDYILDYQKTFNQVHSLSAMLGYSVEKQTYESLTGSRGNTPTNDIHFLDAGDPSTALNGNSWNEWSFLSQFGRVSYSFKDKYYVSGTLRRDGSSRLAKDKYGIFPSVSAAWRIGEEKFMDRFDWLDELKLRLSWGTVGNVLSIDPYGTSIYLSQMNAVFNEKVVSGYTSATAVNTDLKWESTEKKNIGLDLSVLRNSLYFVFDFYIEDTKDLLFQQPIPSSVGLSGSPYINAGHIRNTGIDFEIGYRRSIGDWKFDINFNASHVHNEVIDLDGRDLATSGIKEGYPVGSYYGYISNGIIRTQEDLNNSPQYPGKDIGDIWFKDIDGYDENGNLTGKPDGKVDTADRTLFGKIFPDLNYGLAASVSYKNFTLQLMLQGVQGIEKNMLNGGYATDMFGGEPNMEADYILDRYHPEKNPNGKYPRVAVGDPGQNQLLSDFWMIDASYLSIRNVNLSYSFPKKICDKLKMRDLNMYIGVQNLWTFGNEYSEISSTVSVPIPRTCTFGLQFSF